MTLWCLKRRKQLLYGSMHRFRSHVQNYALREYSFWVPGIDRKLAWEELEQKGYSLVKVKLEEVPT